MHDLDSRQSSCAGLGAREPVFAQSRPSDDHKQVPGQQQGWLNAKTNPSLAHLAHGLGCQNPLSTSQDPKLKANKTPKRPQYHRHCT